MLNIEIYTGDNSLLRRSIRRMCVFSIVSWADSPWAIAVILLLDEYTRAGKRKTTDQSRSTATVRPVLANPIKLEKKTVRRRMVHVLMTAVKDASP